MKTNSNYNTYHSIAGYILSVWCININGDNKWYWLSFNQFGIAVDNYGSPHSLVKLLDVPYYVHTECLIYTLPYCCKITSRRFPFEDLNTKLDDCCSAARSFPCICLCAVLPLMVFEEAKKTSLKTMAKACTVNYFSSKDIIF